MAITSYQILNPLFLQPYFLFMLTLLFSSPTQSISDVEALLKFKNSLSTPEALNSWDPNTGPCLDKNARWNGILCLDGNVIGLHLKSKGLSGNIDVDALASLQGLRTISLEDNEFSGPIPEINRLGYLKAVYLNNNNFTGQISPDFFLKMESLKKLWLANNAFSGDIPSSLTQLRNLLELHLENNQFLGEVPPLKQPPLVSLNLSNNQLRGEIPMSLLHFKASSFEGNPKLCGEVIGVDCITIISNNNQSTSQNSTSPQGELSNLKQSHNNNHFVGVIALVMSIILVLLSLVIIAIFVMKKRRVYKDDIPTTTQNNDDTNSIATTSTTTASNTRSKDGVHVNERAIEVGVEPILQKNSSHSSTSSRRSNNSEKSSRKSSVKGSSNRGVSSSVGGLGQGDLTMVNDEKGVIVLADLMKASAEVLGNGGIGSAYKAIMGNGLGVVVKRMRELNRLESDAFDVEIRKLASLRHRNILPPLAYHYRKDEKLVVYEYVAKGSLHYLLHGDRGISHEELNWPTRLKIIRGTTEGLYYLHSQLQSYDLPHGNLKSSNILIDTQNEPLLSDYGFSPMTNPSVAAQALFGYRAPEAIQHQTISPTCDIYCLGVVILEILTRKFPSQYLSTTKGGTDVVQWVTSAIEEGREVELLDPDIVSHSTSCKESMVKMLHVGVACTEPNRDKRLNLTEVRERIERVCVQGDGGQDLKTIDLL
ncbi:pollen receptor-like kinase 3 [Chenopodium quinoa]|uniref:pollen receptor-like kinase 3 n=1 Tax=Chenopodium quinoa TaxID=63459 RepID=UPI000B77BBCE|nr:pollen receptor-like kinase 3 [Chenopodium quinoa]